MGTHGWAPGGGPVAWLGLGGVPAGSPRGSGAAAATGPGPRPRCGSRGPMGSGGWVRAPAPLSPASLPRWWQQGPVPPQGPRPVPSRTPPPAPTGAVPAPTPFFHGQAWSRSPQAWATPKPPGSVPEVPQSRAGERGQGQHRAPSDSGVGPKAQGRGARAPPKPRGPVRSLLQGPKPGGKEGVRKPNQRSAEFNEFKV